MEFIIKREYLLKSLLRVQGVTEKKMIMPVLENVLMEVKLNKMYFTATDLEVGIHGSIEVEVIKEGKCALLAKKVLEIVRELSGNEVSLILKESLAGAGSLELLCGSAIFNINTTDPEEYPSIPIYEDVDLFDINSEKIRNMIRKTIYAASTDEKKKNINGVFFEKDGKTIRMVGTDGHRLSIIEEDNTESIDLSFKKGVLFPIKGLNELKKILDEDKEDDKISFGFAGNNAIFKTSSILMIIRLMDSQFPDYTMFIPKDQNKRFVINRDRFLKSLKRVSLFSGGVSKSVKLHISQEKIEMTASSTDYGEAYDEIEVDYKDDELTVAFNARYFIEALGVIDSEEVLVELKDCKSGAVVKPVGDDKHKCIVMPMEI